LSRFGRGFGGNNRRNSSKEGLIFFFIKIEDSLGIFLFFYIVKFLLEFDNSVYGRELRGELKIDLLGLVFFELKSFFDFGGIARKASKVDELLVSELSNVFDEFI